MSCPACGSGCRCARRAGWSTRSSSSWVPSDSADRPLSEVEDIVSTVPVLPPGLYALARRVADRAAGSASRHPAPRHPQAQVRVEKAWLGRRPTRRPRRRRASALGPRAKPSRRTRGSSTRSTGPSGWPSKRLPRLTLLRDGATGRRVGARCSRPPRRARSRAGAAPSSSCRITATRTQLAAALGDLVPTDADRPDDARQSGPTRYAAFLRCSPTSPRSSSAIARPSTPRSHDLGLVALWDDGDPLLVGAARARTSTRAMPRSSGRSSRARALLFAGHTRTTDVERLVSIGWLREIVARHGVSLRASCRARTRERRVARRTGAVRGVRGRPRCACRRGPCWCRSRAPATRRARLRASAAHRRGARTAPDRCTPSGPGRTPVCGWCGRAAHGWAVPELRGDDSLRMASSGSERTADELGRAFPGVRVIVADGDASRPAGRRPSGARRRDAGRRTDRRRRISRGHPPRRRPDAAGRRICGSGRPACAGGPTPPLWPHPVRPFTSSASAEPIARALATWTQPAYARAELAERAPLRMPPDRARRRRSRATRAAVEPSLARCATPCPSSTRRRSSDPCRSDDAAGTARARAVRLRARARVSTDDPAGRRRRRRPQTRAGRPRVGRRPAAQYTQSAGRSCPTSNL